MCRACRPCWAAPGKPRHCLHFRCPGVMCRAWLRPLLGPPQAWAPPLTPTCTTPSCGSPTARCPTAPCWRSSARWGAGHAAPVPPLTPRPPAKCCRRAARRRPPCSQAACSVRATSLGRSATSPCPRVCWRAGLHLWRQAAAGCHGQGVVPRRARRLRAQRRRERRRLGRQQRCRGVRQRVSAATAGLGRPALPCAPVHSPLISNSLPPPALPLCLRSPRMLPPPVSLPLMHSPGILPLDASCSPPRLLPFRASLAYRLVLQPWIPG